MVNAPAGQVVKHKKPKDYRYYSLIIPETISKKIKESGKYKITRNNRPFLKGETTTLDNIKTNYSSEFESISKTAEADFIITGLYQILDENLSVKAYIYDAAKKELLEVTTENRETGIYLKETTDNLSKEIEAKLYTPAPVKTEIVEKDNSEKSPFLPLATPLQYTTLGIDVGYLTPHGKWKDIYNNTIYYSPYLTFDIAEYLEFSLKYDYFQTDNEDMAMTDYYKLRVMGGNASLGARIPIFSNFLICFSAGGGVSRSEIIVNPGDPFVAGLADKKSTDPSVEAEISLKLRLSSIQFKTGALYKRIFFEKESMDYSVFFAGAGIHF